MFSSQFVYSINESVKVPRCVGKNGMGCAGVNKSYVWNLRSKTPAHHYIWQRSFIGLEAI